MNFIIILLLTILIITTLLSATTRNGETAAQLSQVISGIGLAMQGLIFLSTIGFIYFIVLNFYEFFIKS